jgi:hypothetical protein
MNGSGNSIVDLMFPWENSAISHQCMPAGRRQGRIHFSQWTKTISCDGSILDFGPFPLPSPAFALCFQMSSNNHLIFYAQISVFKSIA